MILLGLLACGDPCEPERSTLNLEPWPELLAPEGAQACETWGYKQQLNLRRRGSGEASQRALAEETAAALEGKGWSRLEGSEGLVLVREGMRTEIVASAHSDSVVQAQLTLNQHFVREELWPDWEQVMASGQAAEEALKSLEAGSAPRACPTGVETAGLVELWQLQGKAATQGGWATSEAFEAHVGFPEFGELSSMSREAHEERYAYAKALSSEAIVVAQVTTVLPGGVSTGSEGAAFDSGSSRGLVFLVQGGEVLCQAPWEVGRRSQEVKASSQPELMVGDLDRRTRSAMREAAEELVRGE